MSISSVFIRRPIATTLLATGLAMAGGLSFFLLPVAPLPNIDLPTISVSASMSGASPEVMSSTVATPLERYLGSISSVTEMTSSSRTGSTNITLQFDISRNIDGAARDVQAAIEAARPDLPAALRGVPQARKFNPSDQPIMILALTSKTLTLGQIFDQASNILEQRLSQVQGVGDATPSGATLPAIRIDLNPRTLFNLGISTSDVSSAISSANAGENTPKGAIENNGLHYQIYANDTATEASQYSDLIIATRNNASVRLKDVATISEGQENIQNIGIADGLPAVLVPVTKEPGSNVIEVVDRVKQMLPTLEAALPPAIGVVMISDTTVAIRNAVKDVELTLIISTLLVVGVVYFFLRNFRATLVPAVSVPLSLLGTFGLMYLVGFSLDNFSLMALIISTGFVVDDTIVVLENVTRHLEHGEDRLQAALLGAQEVSFTILSMTVSLVAVFFPILLMGGIVGTLFHELALTLCAAMLVSLVVSLTITPMMCAYIDLLPVANPNFLLRASHAAFEHSQEFYRKTLYWALDNGKTIMFLLLVAVCLNVYLIEIVPKSFFPSVDEGRIQASLRASQTISFQLLKQKFQQFSKILASDPAIEHIGGSTSGTSGGSFYVTLKPKSERGGLSTADVIARLQPKMAVVAGAQVFLQSASVTAVRAGGRQGNGDYQFTVLGDDLTVLNTWVPKITDALSAVPELDQVNSDQQAKGLEIALNVNRNSAARLGLTPTQIDSALGNAFAQASVSTIYEDKNQYHVIMEVSKDFWQSPDTLKDFYVSTSGGAVSGAQQTAVVTTAAPVTTVSTDTSASSESAAQAASDAVRNAQQNALTSTGKGSNNTGSAVSTRVETMVPLESFSTYGPGFTPLSVNHQGGFAAVTFSFETADGVSLDTAVQAINKTMADIHVPLSLHGEFAGTAKTFQSSLSNEPILILAAIITIYIVLGMLYESLIHPLTILSTLPSACVGAILALLIFKTDFSMIAFIGVILLIGIVKKNAIIMIDFAIGLQRAENLSSKDAIFRAAVMRFRPIMMTTLAAILGGVPLAVGLGEGSELRQPLGISIVGGLLLSQMLTLYTTPLVYLYLDRFGSWIANGWNGWYHGVMDEKRGHSTPPSIQPAE